VHHFNGKLSDLGGLGSVDPAALAAYVELARGGAGVDALQAHAKANGLPFDRSASERTVASIEAAERRLRPFRDLL
jgi:hypothetical protein